MNNQIEQALENFRTNRSRYARSERYYRGEHNLAFASEKFQNTFGSLFREFAMNLCPAICDAIKDKLKITGFGFDLAKTTPPEMNLHRMAASIWEKNRMALRSGEIHKEALKNGDAYAIVWPDAAGEAAIYANKAANISVAYDDEMPGHINWAAKYWRTHDKRTRINLFYPDRIEKYISAKQSENILPDAKEFVPFVQGGVEHTVANPYGIVPVFHFANNADIGTPGQSELDAAIPIQDGLNKSVLDMLVAMEFAAYRQRWAAGIEIQYDNDGKAVAPFTAGIEHLWISENPEARFGVFEAANLDQFLKVKDSFRIDLASVTGTPLYYLMPQTKGVPSGESMRKAETRFIAKVRDRQEAFGQTWADLMSFALRINLVSETALLTNWEDPSQTTEREMLENILLKRQIGISPQQALAEAGYGDIDIKKMLK